MPRKDKGMFFELHPGPLKDESGNPLLYARPATRKMTMQEVRDLCALRGINANMIEYAFETFIDLCGKWMADGYRIETPLGTFAPKIKLQGEFTDPSKVQGSDVQYAGIEVTPSKQFIKAVRYHINGFRKKSNVAGNAQMKNEAFMADALRQSMLQSGFTTISKFMAASGLKYHSAQRYLDRLCYCVTPKLRQQKIGGVLHYFPV